MKKNRYLTDVNAVVEMARAHKRVVISNQLDFQAVTHRLTSKAGKMFSVMSLNYNQSTGSLRLFLSNTGISRLTGVI
jgi:hypothetical protein